MIELGNENGCSDRIKFRTEREKVQTTGLSNGDYFAIISFFFEKR